MKPLRILLISLIILLIFREIASAQIPILNEYDFTEGGYCLIRDPNAEEYQNSIAPVAYFDDVVSLERLQAELTFSNEPVGTRAGYCEKDSYLYVCRNGEIKESFAIFSECNYIEQYPTKYEFGGYFPFEGYKIARVQKDTFPDLVAARKRWQELYELRSALYLPRPEWLEFEGTFSFYPPLKSEDEWSGVSDKYSSILHSNFPNERFKIVEVTHTYRSFESGKKYVIELRCNKSLFDKFHLYPISYGGWEYYKLDIMSYWKQG